MARILIETFCTNNVIAASGQNYALIVQEFYAIYDWIKCFAILSCVPIVFDYRMLEIAEVPQLDTFAKRSTTSHHILVVVADVNSVAAD